MENIKTYGIVIGMLFSILRMGDAYAEAEPEEITIHIPSGHKGVVLALLEAIDEGTPVTGIAELDSLAATYGLIGIYRPGRRSSGLYGYRFRLTFPPGADVAAMAKAYGNLSYTQSQPVHPLRTRIAGKLLYSTLVGSTVFGGGVVSLGTFIRSDIAFATALWFGYPVGVGLGASLLDRYDYSRSLFFSIGGSYLGVGISLALIHRNPLWDPFGTIAVFMIVPPITATLASELFRKPPESDRFSVGLVPDARGNWSARATLRF